MVPTSWIEYATSNPAANNMQLIATSKPRPTYAARLSDEQRADYFRHRRIARAGRWWEYRYNRLSRWDRQEIDESHPVPGLQRSLTPIVQQFDPCYYCLASVQYSENLPEHHSRHRYDGTTFYRVEVFVNLGRADDPRVAQVDCRTVRGLRMRLNAALAALGPDPDVFGMLPITEAWREHLVELLQHPDTAAEVQAQVFYRVLQKLSMTEGLDLTQTLLAGIRSRQPGCPGYAARHGLNGTAEA